MPGNIPGRFTVETRERGSHPVGSPMQTTDTSREKPLYRKLLLLVVMIAARCLMVA